MLLSEIYRESRGSSFTHDGHRYDLNKLFKLVENIEVQEFDVDDLDWILEYAHVNAVRVKKADLSKPILVVKWHRRYAVVDGAHRLTKAVEQNVKQLPGKLVMQEQLDAVEIK